MSAVEVVLVDAFTSTPFAGNPAAVVPDATGLDEATMRAIAVEMARPATAFLRPAAAGGDRGLRWFSPAGVELTLCGHGTVAAATSSPRAARRPAAGSSSRARVTGSRSARGVGGLRDRVVRAGLPALGAGAGDLSPFLAIARAARGGRRGLGAARADVGAGSPDPGRRRSTRSGRWRPTSAALGRLARDRGVRGVVLTARETREPGALTHSRNFIPHFGIPEDPATGSSHAAIGVWLWETGGLVAADGVARFRAEQGDFQGRPGRLAVEVHGVPGRATRVRVGGQAVIVLTGALSLP